MELKAKISDLQKDALLIKEKINDLLLSMPDNPDIKRIRKEPNCSIMSFSAIAKSRNRNMSPCFYDWKYQYEKLILKINATEICNLVIILEEIVKRGFFILDKEKIQLHPEVIKQLKSIL